MLRVVLPFPLVLVALGAWPALSLAQSARTAAPTTLRAFEYTARPTTLPAAIPDGTPSASVGQPPRGALTLVSPGTAQAYTVSGTPAPAVPRQTPPTAASSPSPNSGLRTTAPGNANGQPVRDPQRGGQPAGNNARSAVDRSAQPANPGNQSGPKELSANERLEPDRAKAESTPSKKVPSRLTDPMLQNMSNPQNLSHAGISRDQQTAPNLYFGHRFDNWSGQMSAMPQPINTGELPRFQPGRFGGYIAPNTYLGGGNSSWSNLSTGRVSPSPVGAWGYSSSW